MNNKKNKILTFGKASCLIWSLIVLAIAVSIVIFVARLKRDHIETATDQIINPTPTLIRSMQNIGEWEFLAIADEELIDTVRPGIFTNDELVRIYYGTLTARNDTLFARIPRIELLDNNFIDEGLTKSFYESGTWTDKDRADLYDRAYQQMKKRCLTPANIKTAEASCTTQFTKIFKALGYEKVSITYDK